MVVLLEISPISTEELYSSIIVTIGLLVLPDQGPLHWFFNLAGRPAVGRVLVIPNFFHWRMTEATLFLGTFNPAEMFWYPSPELSLDKILPWRSTDNSFDLMAWFLFWQGTVNYGILYRQVCAFLNHVQSIEFTTGRLQSSCRNISRMIDGNRMLLSSISSLIAKVLNTFVNKVFLYYICYIWAKNSKNLFLSLSLWGIVCRLMKNKFNLIHFRMRL